VVLHGSTGVVQEAIACSACHGDAITVATNDEARELNARIREERVRDGMVDDQRTVTGSDGLAIGTGDVIQTRQNDSDVQVANRQTWSVQSVGADGTVWVKEVGTSRKHERTVRLPAEYVAEHTHLAYATTAYGVQGATMPESHTILSDSLDSAGMYVGMTRGREANRLHVVAADLDDAREQFTAALERDRADRGLTEATRAAQEGVAGLVPDGPVRLVNAERARLAQQIERADRQAAEWERAAIALDRQQQEHQAEAEEQQAILESAEAIAERVRAKVAAPLIDHAAHDGAVYLAARNRMGEAEDALRTAKGLHRRTAARALTTAVDEHRTVETAARRRWGTLPQAPEGIVPWATTVAHREADAHPRVVEARVEAYEVSEERQRLRTRQLHERARLQRRVFGGRAPSNAQAQAGRWRSHAEAARHDLAAIKDLPITEAAQLVRARAEKEAAQHEAGERAVAEHQARAAGLHDFTRLPPDHGTVPSERRRGL
jgi:hypothetical protein